MMGTMRIILVHQCIRMKPESNYIVNKVRNRKTARRQLLIQGKCYRREEKKQQQNNKKEKAPFLHGDCVNMQK